MTGGEEKETIKSRYSAEKKVIGGHDIVVLCVGESSLSQGFDVSLCTWPV